MLKRLFKVLVIGGAALLTTQCGPKPADNAQGDGGTTTTGGGGGGGGGGPPGW